MFSTFSPSEHQRPDQLHKNWPDDTAPAKEAAMRIEYTERAIALVDVLGFSAFVNNDDHEVLDRYYEATNRHLGALRAFADNIKTLQISDSIVMAVPANEPSLKELIKVTQGLQFGNNENKRGHKSRYSGGHGPSLLRA